MDEEPKQKYFIGLEVAKWPEFKAFALRLGIDMDAPITDLIIDIPANGVVAFEMRQLATITPDTGR